MNDLVKRALHTFWQAFVAAVGIAYAASGLDVSTVTDLNSAKKFGWSLVLALGAAALSAVKTTIAQLTESSAISDDEDPDPDVPVPSAPPAHGHEVTPANMHADDVKPQG